MIRLITLILLVSSHIALAAPSQPIGMIKDPAALLQNELNRIDTIIYQTQKSLEDQKKLRLLIEEYKKIQDDYLKKSQDNDLLLALVKSAHRTLKAINESHLTETFDPEFIEELTVLSLAAGKRGVPKP